MANIILFLINAKLLEFFIQKKIKREAEAPRFKYLLNLKLSTEMLCLTERVS